MIDNKDSSKRSHRLRGIAQSAPHSYRKTSSLVACALLGLAACESASAFNYVADANGTYWGIQDAAPPRVDTGSIRATQVGAGQSPAYSTGINGFGGIKVTLVAKAQRQGRDALPPRLNGELMRGFGLQFDGVDRFNTTQSLNLGGVTISRSVYINRGANWGRWLDTFTNTTPAALIIKVAFGGQSGMGDSGSNSSAIVSTSSGDATVSAADAWVNVATPLSGNTLVGGPQVTVLGTPGPFAGAMSATGNWLVDTFNTPLAYTGHEGNFPAYVNTLTIPAGKSMSLLHFIVLGQRVTATTSASVRAAVESTAGGLAAAPQLTGLTTAEICSIANFNVAALSIPGFSYASCKAPAMAVVAQAPVPPARDATTSSKYDVVEKTIGQLRADMEAGVTTSAEITRAYLDRVEVYDKGQFGFNAYEIVASDAMEQAARADAARAMGQKGALLGIPIVLKNLYDTKDMATTNGSLTFAGFRPSRDAFQVARLRAAGAVIIGKAALEEYATSGNYSNDAWGQVWNVFNPSKSALASSGGSASALAASLAAGALGSQTGDSLYAPASGASLVTLRGTDGLQSGTGIMPLSWLTDFGGAITRSVPDLADMLNVVAGTDPEDPTTAPADSKVPADWRSVLDVNALRGARIGYIPSVWIDPFGTTGTTNAEKAALQTLVDAGATIVQMGQTAGGADTPPSPPDATTGNLSQEGWMQYITTHPELVAQGFKIFSAVDVSCSQVKVAYTRVDASACAVAPAARMSQPEIDAKRAQRVIRQAAAKAWMDAAGVDAVVYPGLLSDISLNDGGGGKASFGRRDTPSASYGIPTVIFPAGFNDHGQPINLQLLGRAWDDPKLVGYAYAFEQRANATGHGHVSPTTVPVLAFKAS
ncbi:MAG: Amidase, partial [Rhizobacter sp.]|nr:Amidase [Rhizobacter sp.]